MIGDYLAYNAESWSRVDDVDRDGEFIVFTFDDGEQWRVHPMRRVSVNRKGDS